MIAMEPMKENNIDITFNTENGHFNYRACAVIIHDGAILAMKDERSPYYYLPGGRVALHERAEDAVLREVREEMQLDAKISRPLWLNQAFFVEDVNHERYHELCLYFLMDITETDLLLRGKRFACNEGNRTHIFEWLPFERLKDAYFYPKFLKRDIFHLPDVLTIRSEFE